MSDTYGVVGGAGDEPGLPPINLPSLGTGQQPLRITIQKTPPPPAHPDGAAGSLPEYAPPAKAEAKGSGEGAAAHLPDYAPTAAQAPARETTTQEAQLGGAANALTFGAAPAIAGAAAASGYQTPDMTTPRPAHTLADVIADPGKAAQDLVQPAIDAAKYLGRPFVGAAKMLVNSVSDHPDPAVQDAYRRGRDAALQNEQLLKEQHPAAFLTGQLFGGLAGPAFGAMAKSATLAGRVARGAAAGGIGGGLYGGGTALSEGADVPGIAQQAGTGALTGAALGGALGGVFGPRAVDPNAPGQRAARTAQSLGAPLPRAVASDSPSVQMVGQQASQIPVVGARISRRAGKAVTAVGEKVGELAEGMAPAQSRAGADMVVRPALERMIAVNKAEQDVGYTNLRRQISNTQRFSMPRTQKMLATIKARRAEAGWANPGEGLGQIEAVAAGSTFNGAHRARADARNAGKTGVPHPGYDAGDYRALVKMMTQDLRDMVRGASSGGAPGAAAAVDAFDRAERQFGKLAEQNELLDRLLKAGGENAAATIMGAAREKGGNLRLLGQLRAGMAPQDFQVISGTLLHELGMPAGKPGEFSLNKFTTEWKKLSDGAKTVLFSPAHKQMLDDFAQLGEHIKGGDQYKNTSNTAGAIILWDIIRAAGEGGVAYAAGLVEPGAALSFGALAGASDLLTRYMASPAGAAALGTWTRAYQDLTQKTFTAARQAAFVMATRNLANTIGVPIDKVADIIRQLMPAAGSYPPQ